jgi:DNA-3-methyladenine glycosylase
MDGYDLCHPASILFVEAEAQIPDTHVLTGPRIGLNSVPEPWKSVPWRFRVNPSHIDRLPDESSC